MVLDGAESLGQGTEYYLDSAFTVQLCRLHVALSPGLKRQGPKEAIMSSWNFVVRERRARWVTGWQQLLGDRQGLAAWEQLKDVAYL